MNINWKRIAALALCLCMLCACALADGNNQTLYNGEADYDSMTTAEWNARENFSPSIAAIGDTAYLLSQNAMWCWHASDPELTKLDYPVANANNYSRSDDGVLMNADSGEKLPEGTLAITDLKTDGKVLYGFDTSTMYNDPGYITVYEMLDESGAFTGKQVSVLTLKTEDGEGSEGYYNTNGFCIANGKVYIPRTEYNDSGWSNYSIYQFELGADSEGTPLKTESEYVTAVTPYKDGKLLARVYDEEHAYDEKTQQMTYPACNVLDPATGKLEPLFTGTQYGAGSFTYLPWQDAISFFDGSRVRMWHPGDTEAAVAAYLPSEMYDDGSGSLAVLNSDVIIFCYNSSIISRELDTSLNEGSALIIYGGWGDTPHTKFVLNHPEILTSNGQEYYSSIEDLTSAMVSGAGVDVMMMDSGYSPVDQLINKGYALNLSDYPAITELAAKMYPALTERFTRDGKLYAMPVSCYADGLGVNEETMQKLGLTYDDLPTSLYGVLDMLENWEADYGDDFEDVVPFSDMGLRNSLTNRIMNMYVAYQMQQGGTLSFDTDLFRKLMEKLEKIDFAPIDHEYDQNNEAANEEWWNKESLFYNSGDVLSPRYYRDNKPIILSLDDGMSPVLSIEPTVLMINPKSAHVEQAVLYVTEYLQNLDKNSTMVTFFPDMNEPVIDPHYEEYLEQWKKNIAECEEQLKTVEPDQKKDLENYIEYLQKRIDNPDESRYIISPDNLQYYREQVAPYLYVAGKTVMNTYDKDGNNEFYTQMQMYQDGALTLDQFIKEIDKRVKMMQLEDQ